MFFMLMLKELNTVTKEKTLTSSNYDERFFVVLSNYLHDFDP